jgi:hypothetical protein
MFADRAVPCRVHRRLTLALAVPLLALAACGSDDDRTVSVDTSDSTAEVAETTVAEDTTGSTASAGETTVVTETTAPVDTTVPVAAAPVPDGFVLVDQSASGYTIAIPSNWTTMSEEDFLANAEAGADLLELDPSMQQLATMALNGADVFAAIDPSTGANVNALIQAGAVPVTLLSSLMQTQLTEMGATNVVIDDSEAASGRLSVSLELSGTPLQQLYLSTDDSLIIVTVTNAGPEVTDAIFASIQLV